MKRKKSMKTAYMVIYDDALAELVGMNRGVWVRNEDEASVYLGVMNEGNAFAVVVANEEVILIADALPEGVRLATEKRQTWAYLVNSISNVVGDCTSVTEVEFEQVRVNSGVCVAGDWFLTISGLVYGAEMLFRQSMETGGQVWPHREVRPVYAKQQSDESRAVVIDSEQMDRMRKIEELTSMYATLVDPTCTIAPVTTE
jgi:hypothetical protein